LVVAVIREALKKIMQESSSDVSRSLELPMIFLKLLVQRADEVLANGAPVARRSGGGAPLGRMVLRVPSLRHLLALKCHALKTTPAHRVLKDLQDVTTLVDANRLDVRDEQFKQLVLKYGHAELYERLVRMCG
jgi:hypothetical protein